MFSGETADNLTFESLCFGYSYVDPGLQFVQFCATGFRNMSLLTTKC